MFCLPILVGTVISITLFKETDGKENHLKSPYLDEEFVKARELGIIKDADNVGGSWSALSDAGEATNLNLAHVMK